MRGKLAALAVLGLAVFAFAFASPAHADDGLTITTRDGAVRGMATDGVREFKGIPFAAPPVGARRWTAPAPATPWTGVRPATTSGPWCPQSIPLPQSEDCLFTDVYAPAAAGSTKLPVMVWLYGGGNTVGADNYWTGAALAKRGVVVVMPNFRVGAMGALALPGSGGKPLLTGNYGILDQQAALRWTRDNAAAFGGDPDNVTLFGQSAGGSNVCNQLVSPAARGLFQKAIVQSGGCDGQRSLEQKYGAAAYAESIGIQYAKQQGCSGTPDATLACLRAKPLVSLMASPLNGFSTNSVTFSPNTDGTVLTERPSDAFPAGHQSQVPVMVGWTQSEGRLFVASLNHGGTYHRVTATELRDGVSSAFPGNGTAVADHYAPGGRGDLDLALSAAYTDGQMACPGATTLADLDRTGPAAYGYEFSEQHTPISSSDPLMPLGAPHGADLIYLKLSGYSFPLTAADERLSSRMITYWTTFARIGSPGPDWPELSSGNIQDLSTGHVGPVSLASVRAAHDCGFWDSLP